MTHLQSPPILNSYAIGYTAALIICVFFVASAAFGVPEHKPSEMPSAKPESVDMTTEGLRRIDSAIQEQVTAGHIQGAVTVVARRGMVVHFSSHGQMDVKKKRPMEHDAIYRMASSSKTVLGVAAMILIEEGKMQPNDPVSKYIPAFANVKVVELIDANYKEAKSASAKPKKKFKTDVPKYRLVPAETPVTVHHLLTHTSGIMSGGYGHAVNPVKRTAEDTLATYVTRIAKVPLDFQPGTRWSYSPRTGLDVVARVIEIIAGTSYDRFLRERIFDPLKMNSTYFNLPETLETKRVVLNADWAKAKGWGRRTNYYSASGGLSSTAEDFLHFQQMLLNGGVLFGHRILSPDSVAMMRKNQVRELYSAGKKGKKGTGFGYTVAVTLEPEEAGNHRGKGSYGWGGAFGTMSWSDPENELVVVIMLQQPHGYTLREIEKLVSQAIIK